MLYKNYAIINIFLIHFSRKYLWNGGLPCKVKMERRVRRKAPARCGTGEKTEDIFNAGVLPIVMITE